MFTHSYMYQGPNLKKEKKEKKKKKKEKGYINNASRFKTRIITRSNSLLTFII